MSSSSVLKRGRRHFLMGAGGFTLALPFLGSLERKAAAGVAPYAKNPRFICMATSHGGVWNQNMYPGESLAGTAVNVYPGHDMHWGALAPNVANGQTTISPCLSASSSLMSPAIIAKMNVIRGLDYSFYIGHHRGGVLGNLAANDGNSPEFNPSPMPTIDQIMAWSPNFYPDIDQIKVRSMHIEAAYGAMSHTYENPSMKSGNIVPVPSAQSSLALFNQIFVPPDMPDPNPRPLIVDKVREHYSRLRTGAFGDAKRLSQNDKVLLDAHMERLLELDRKLKVVASCDSVDVPSEDVGSWNAYEYPPVQNATELARWFQLYNDVVVAAMVCGTSRIAIYGSYNDGWADNTDWNDWHQEVAHVGGGGVPADPAAAAKRDAWQDTNYKAHQGFYRSVFLDLVNKLDAVEETDGVTALDNSLVMWTQESGNRTHDNVSIPVVTAGSAAGFFETGNYYDFRNRSNTLFGNGQQPTTDNYRPGVLYNQWLANMLLSMNVTPAEFESDGEKGYGYRTLHDLWSGNDPRELWPDALRAGASNPLPHLVKGT